MSVEERLARIEKEIEEMKKTLEKLLPLAEKVEELEKHGTLSFITKLVEKAATSFELLADPKNLTIATALLSAAEALAQIDPTLLTMVTDSLAKCAAKLQDPDALKMLTRPPEIGGLMGMLRLIGDPDVKKLLGLLYVYAKIIGGCLPAEVSKQAEHLQELYAERKKK